MKKSVPNALTVTMRGQPVLRIARMSRPNGKPAEGLMMKVEPGFAAGGVNLSPFAFRETEAESSPGRLAPGALINLKGAKLKPFGYLPGLLADSLPDRFGRKALRKLLRDEGYEEALADDPLVGLSYLGDRGLGALDFVPDIGGPTSADFLDFARLRAEAMALSQGGAGEIALKAMREAVSLGGAHAKTLVGLKGDVAVCGCSAATMEKSGYEPWILKLSIESDEPHAEYAGAIEAAYMMMARSAGIHTAHWRTIKDDHGTLHYATARFDREQGRRLHLHSLSGLLELHHSEHIFDYESLLAVTRELTGDDSAVREAFRRAVFNVCTANCDDHAKNHAFLLDLDTKEWRLSPAYDLTFNPRQGEQAMAVMGAMRPTATDLLRLAVKARIHDPKGIIAEVCDAVLKWDAFAEAQGLPSGVAASIGMRFPRL